jgi:hypothetical protein
MIGPRPGGLPRRPVETAATEKLRLCGKNGEERKGTKPGGGAGQGTRRKKGRRAAAAAGGNSRGLAIGRAAAAKRIEDNRLWPPGLQYSHSRVQNNDFLWHAIF